jgi:hypothetical protein
MLTDLPLPDSRLPRRHGRWFAISLAILLGTVLILASMVSAPASNFAADGPPATTPKEASATEVRQFCGRACHTYPPPESFPRSTWRREIKQAYDFFRQSELQGAFPSQESVALYYEHRAPEVFPFVKRPKADHPPSASWRRTDHPLTGEATVPAISHVNLVHLYDNQRLDVLACEMRQGQVLALQPYSERPTWHVLYSHGPDKGFNPAHAEVVDLDGDGIRDVLVANLGYFGPTDAPVGSVLWLRGLGGDKFEPHTLLEGVGRVDDVQAADFRGRGKLDLIVAAFGWRNSGEIIYLENQTTDWKKPRFVPRILDERHGTIQVPVADLNGDGKPDFVALISQEHETIVAFLNEGGKFHNETIYTAPHPAYGSSGIELVDLNGDGKLDVLYTNGDTLDPPYLLKPYHGIQWLENRGEYPFVHHPISPMYGVMHAVAGDFTGDGKIDILAVSFLRADEFSQRKELQLDSVLLLEQKEHGAFVPHSLEASHNDHFTCATGDIYHDGQARCVVGNFSFNESHKMKNAVTIWQPQITRQTPRKTK